jgi:hypothetical protein
LTGLLQDHRLAATAFSVHHLQQQTTEKVNLGFMTVFVRVFSIIQQIKTLQVTRHAQNVQKEHYAQATTLAFWAALKAWDVQKQTLQKEIGQKITQQGNIF